MCEKSSKPRKASEFRYAGSNTIFDLSDGTSPLCRGIPNFSEKSDFIFAIIFMTAPVNDIGICPKKQSILSINILFFIYPNRKNAEIAEF